MLTLPSLLFLPSI